MFYAQFVLAKKGPLARIWLAAHWDKKLTKAHVFETNIEKSVDGILQPKVKMALRTSGHLLLGVVRIYSRKAKYLLADCNEAFVKIKMAFRPGMVDLPEENREAAVTAITLPEVFHDFDTAMPELNDVDIEAQFSLNQSRAEEITMREDYGNISALVNQEEGFGDMGFDTDTPELLRHASGLEPSFDQANLLFSDGVDHLEKEKEPQPSTSAGGLISRSALEIDAPIRDDGFGGNLGQDIITGGLFEGGLFDDAPMGEVTPVENSSIAPGGEQPLDAIQQPPPDGAATIAPESEEDEDDHFGGPPSVGGNSSDAGSRPVTPAPELPAVAAGVGLEAPATPAPVTAPPIDSQFPEVQEEEKNEMQNHVDQTTLLHNEEESFALAPVDASAFRGFTKTKRKRKLIVDEVKNISGEEMKAQLSDTTDIVTTLDLAPPTKRLMHWKETGGVEKLFALTGRNIPARALFKNYQRHLTSRAVPNDDYGILGDGEKDQLPLEPQEQLEQPAVPAVEPGRRGRKRKQPELEEQVGMGETLDQVAAVTVQQQPQPVEEMLPVHPPPPATPGPPPPSVPPPSTPAPIVPPETPDMSQLALNPSLVESAPQTPYPLNVPSIPQLQPDQVSSLLEQPATPMIPHTEPSPVMQAAPPTPAPAPTPMPPTPAPAPALTPAPVAVASPEPQPPPLQQPYLENMGYDQENTLMANMGYDEQHPPAMTPGAISEKGQATPWNEDYELPVSVGPAEEQATDETYEQFEERVLNKRAAHFYHLVKTKMQHTDKLYLSDLTHRNNRKQVAQKFYSMLVLKKFQVLDMKQDSSYDEILLLKGPTFENPTL
ncbi:RAD21 cohesin complex component verthandi isoform X2 [Lycorma delicatula]|uniref:RAD21 cohesin complex component verthandi isoform X2 n=1 Tax=Lycorma delicatula TaxID=130591 RepID=UPI003F51287E